MTYLMMEVDNITTQCGHLLGLGHWGGEGFALWMDGCRGEEGNGGEEEMSGGGGRRRKRRRS